GPLVVGSENLVAAPVIAHERTALGDPPDVVHVGGLALVADEHTREVGPVLRENRLLHVAPYRVLAVADQRQTGFGGGHGRGGDDLAIVLPGGIAGRDLDAPGLDPGLADAVVDLVQV